MNSNRPLGLIPNEQLQEETHYRDQVLLLNEASDDGGWEEHADPHPAFAAILTNFYALSSARGSMPKVFIDPHINREEAAKNSELGVFDETYGSARITLNWTGQWKGTGKSRVPPWHMMVHWGDTLCGVLGPKLYRRICWQYSCAVHTKPDEPCHMCGTPDWITLIIRPEHVVQTLAEELARRTGRDELWDLAEGKSAEAAAKAGEHMG